MLKYEYINKEWIVSPTARRVYRASAALSVALFFCWWAILVAGRIPETLVPVVRLLLLACARSRNHFCWNGVLFVSLR